MSGFNPVVDSEFMTLVKSKEGGPGIFATGYPEHQFEGRYRLQEGDTYVEAGAFWARYGLIASHRVGPHGRVILIEGNPYNQDMIEKVVSHYQLKNVALVKGIVWSRTEETTFCISGNPAGSRKATSSDLINYPDDVIEVQAYKLDDLLSSMKIDYIDILACDVEGAEWEMVQGADKYFTSHRIRNVALAAYHDFGAPRPHLFKRIIWFLEERGYQDLEYHPDLPQYGGLVYGHV